MHASGWAAREGCVGKVTKSRDLKEGKEPALWIPCRVVHATEIVQRTENRAGLGALISICLLSISVIVLLYTGRVCVQSPSSKGSRFQTALMSSNSSIEEAPVVGQKVISHYGIKPEVPYLVTCISSEADKTSQV